jgi:hypothetical protein
MGYLKCIVINTVEKVVKTLSLKKITENWS